jgi:beta-glucanase (GH16 family)
MARRLVAVFCLLAVIPAVVPTAGDGHDGSNHRLIWSDEFDGPAGDSPNPTKWNFDIGGRGWGNNELQHYTARPSNAGLDGQGDLVITAYAERYTGPNGVTREYTSARLQTLHTFQFKYGLMEARIQVPRGAGLLSDFWSLGNNAYNGPRAWPKSGEIDAMEVLGSAPRIVHGAIHGPWSWAPGGVGGVARSTESLSAGFHTYGVKWGPTRISFLLDGTTYKTIKPSDLRPGSRWPFRRRSFLLLSLAVGGNWPGRPDASTPFPARMVVDWVRVWQ